MKFLGVSGLDFMFCLLMTQSVTRAVALEVNASDFGDSNIECINKVYCGEWEQDWYRGHPDNATTQDCRKYRECEPYFYIMHPKKDAPTTGVPEACDNADKCQCATTWHCGYDSGDPN
ncbi:MAG: hypothetical protein M1838_004770 [Thelocarpon superellum]|nr:MAG: hypothetical protein M1838_004770 [Thelocarpon superellum]